jgi:hypothetical protein
MSQETNTKNIKLLQERKAMEESDHELTKELFASSLVLPPIEKQNTDKCMQHDKPELLKRQRRTTIRINVNKMEENNIKLMEFSKKLKETKKLNIKMADIFGNSSDEWDNYVYLEDKCM